MTPAALAIATAVPTLAALGYAGSCWVFPFRRCWVCDGTGRHTSGKNLRPCRWCKGTGRRLRLGRRAANWAARRRREVRR